MVKRETRAVRFVCAKFLYLPENLELNGTPPPKRCRELRSLAASVCLSSLSPTVVLMLLSSLVAD